MHSPIISLALVTISLIQIGQAASTSDLKIIQGTGKFGCKYEVHSFSQFNTYPIEPEQYGFFSSSTTSLAKCTELCDDHGDCVASSLKRNEKGQDRCHAAVGQFGFSRPSLNSTTSASKTVVQLVPNSCSKRAATPTPVMCSPGTVKGEGGCKWHFTCGEELGDLDYATIISFKTPEECYKATQEMRLGFGFTWYQGGNCRINSARSAKHSATLPRSRTVTAQIVAGSCKKAD